MCGEGAKRGHLTFCANFGAMIGQKKSSIRFLTPKIRVEPAQPEFSKNNVGIESAQSEFERLKIKLMRRLNPIVEQ